MKTFLALLLMMLPVVAAAENTVSSEDREASARQSGKPSPSALLAAQIHDIARSASLSPKEKGEEIATAVKNAIGEATAQLKDPAEVLKVALEFATIAAKAAPQFTDAITNAVLAIPSIAGIDGAAGRIQTAVVDAATKATEAEFSSDRSKTHKDKDRDDRDHEFGGHDDDTVVSRYR